MTKLSELTVAAEVDTGDDIYVVRNGNSLRAPMRNVLADVNDAIDVVLTTAGMGSGVTVGGTEIRSNGVRFNEHGINVMEFGADNTGATQTAEDIQAAIDYAMDNSIPAVYIPPGRYLTSNRPIWLDPPGNMRGADGTNGPTYAAGTTYDEDYTVNSGGIAYISLVGGNIGNTPVSSPAHWRVFAWNVATAYSTGDVVSRGGVPWRALQASTGEDPLLDVIGTGSVDEDNLFWEPYWIAPNRFNFMCRLYGVHGAGHEGAMTTRLDVGESGCSNSGIYVGPGQGMKVDGIALIKTGLSQGNIAKRGHGIGVAGGSGGATRTTISDCWMEHFEVGVITGFNSDSLSDSNFLVRCAVFGCYIGAFIPQTQNFINTFLECSFANTINIWAQNGTGFRVYGGNYSAAGARDTFTIDSASAVTQTDTGSGTTKFNITYTLATPDDFFLLDHHTYERFCVKTVHWGIIPFDFVSWDPDTFELELQVWTVWQYLHLGPNFTMNADLEDELQAPTLLYANEWHRSFIGGAKVKNVHIELDGQLCHTLLWASTSFANDVQASLEDIFYNSSIPGDSTEGVANTAMFYNQLVTPWIFIDTDGVQVYVRNVRQSLGSGRTGANIWQKWDDSQNAVTFQHCEPLILVIPTMHNTFPFRVLSDFNQTHTPQAGTNSVVARARFDFGHHNMLGYYPHPASVPSVTEATLAAWMANTQSDSGSQPLMMGGQLYSLREEDANKAQVANIRSDHWFLTASGSYTRDWEYKGGSRVVCTGISNLQQGQVITLNNGDTGGDGDVNYLIHEILFATTGAASLAGARGYCYVDRIGGGDLDGDTGVTYTGATIGQQSTNVSYTILPQSSFVDADTGATVVMGDRETELILGAGKTLGTLTITLPANPRDRQIVTIRGNHVVTALTMQAGAGESLATGAPTAFAAGGLTTAIFRAANSTWYF